VIKRTTIEKGRKLLVIEEDVKYQAGPPSGQIRAHLCESDGTAHHLSIHMVYKGWKPWRWVLARNDDTGQEAWAFWGMPWFPPGLIKVAIRRALDQVHQT
jgi:hypothetical protein